MKQPTWLQTITGIFGSSDLLVMIGVGLCIFFITRMNADAIFKWIKEQSLGSREYVIQKLREMDAKVSEKDVTRAMLLGSFGLGFLFFLLFWPNVKIGLTMGALVTLGGFRLPRAIVDNYYQARCSKFVDQLVEGLAIMARALESGAGIQDAMRTVYKNMETPISSEFGRMLADMQNNMTLADSFVDLGRRIPYPDVMLVVNTVKILDQQSSSFAQPFETISKTIRERIKMEKKISAIMSQSVTQGIVLTIMPFALLILMYAINPDYIMPLFTNQIGWAMLAMVLVLQIAGGLWIRAIVKIKV